MWNPNSDNKTEDVSIAETTNQSQQQQQQQALNIVDNKSQHQQNPSQSQRQTPSNIAGNGKITKAKNLEGESSSSTYGGGGGGGGSYCASDNNNSSSINCGSGGVDSGFLSGPQLTEDYDFDLKESNHTATAGTGIGGISSSGKTIPTVQLNITHPSTEDYQDSGIIDEDLVEVEEEHHQLHQQQQQQQQQKPSITTTAATPQTQQRNIVATPTTAEQDQMILDSGVDAGVAEWFCKLTLKDSNQRLNNLGAANQNRFHVSNSHNKNAADSDPWEIYYQQNNEGDTQLHLACTGYVDVVAALIRMAPHPCLFNIQNDDAQTGLHLAVIYRQPKILRMLLIAGAEPTVRDANGNTPLHLACYSGDIQCANALITPISASEIYEAHRSYGHLSSDKTTSCLDCAHLPADLEIRNYDGERCVHLAAQGGHIEILKGLVWFGADINAREGKSGRTPLHIAIETCNEVLANFLLEECLKLNLETETYAGLTAYQVACALNNSTMQNNLERRGAEPLTPPDSDYDSSDIETDLDDSQIYDRFGDPRFFANYNGGNPINVA